MPACKTSAPSTLKVLYSTRPPLTLNFTLPFTPTNCFVLSALVADARSEGQHADEIAPVQGRLLDLLRGDDLVDLGLFGFHMANAFANDLDFFGTGGRWFERAIHFNFLVRGENQILGREVLEALDGNLEGVGSGSRVEEVLTLRIGGGGLSCARRAGERDDRIREHRVRLVGDGAENLGLALFVRGAFEWVRRPRSPACWAALRRLAAREFARSLEPDRARSAPARSPSEPAPPELASGKQNAIDKAGSSQETHLRTKSL